jgi:hypothetical protein
MPSPLMKSGTRKLSDIALKVVAPTGVTSTAWPSVRDVCSRKLGITFDPWQDGAGRLILAKRADGKLAVMIGGVGMSVPRQVGKTYLIGAIIFALCILRPGLLVIWSAHHARTHGETFLSMQALADRSKVKPYIRAIYVGSGDEEIRFNNGSRVLFGARERGFGRGIPGVDVIVSDEAQIMTDKALDAQLATMNTSRFGLAIFVGTPPRPEDPSEAFTRMRTEAWAGSLQDAVWIEIGAAQGADPDDRKVWAKANPSFPHRTPVESMLRLRRKLTPESFLREGLGIWDGREADDILPGWDDRFLDAKPPPVVAIGLAVSLDGAWGSIGAAGNWPDDERVNVGAVDRRRDTSWMIAKAKRIQDAHDCYVVIDAKCPDASLIGALEDAGVQLTIAKMEDCFEACSEMVNRVREGQITHQRTPELDAAVAGAAWRWVIDRKLWGRKQSASDVAMLEAVTLAAWKAAGTYDVLESIH